MNALTATASTQVKNSQVKDYQPRYIFVVMLNSGVLVIGQANNPSKRICALNSGMNPLLPEPNSIFKIVGIKERTEERTLVSVVKRYYDNYGEKRVLCV